MTSHIESQNLAPVALFVFNRPDHTLLTLKALSDNPEFLLSPLFIFCDGARNTDESDKVERTRMIVENWSHPAKIVTKSDRNQGLAKSVIAGVTDLTERFGCVIVVEDDLLVNQDFLRFMNAALVKYRDVPQVMQVSAYMFPIPEFADMDESLFFSNITSWGWATWSRAWKHFDAEATGWRLLLNCKELRYRFNVSGAYDYSDILLRQMTGEIDSWAIRWNWSVFRLGGLVSYPPISFVKNIGFDGSGTHCRTSDYHHKNTSSPSADLVLSEHIKLSENELRFVRGALLEMSGSLTVRILKLVRNAFLRIKLKWFNHFFKSNSYMIKLRR